MTRSLTYIGRSYRGQGAPWPRARSEVSGCDVAPEESSDNSFLSSPLPSPLCPHCFSVAPRGGRGLCEGRAGPVMVHHYLCVASVGPCADLTLCCPSPGTELLSDPLCNMDLSP